MGKERDACEGLAVIKVKGQVFAVSKEDEAAVRMQKWGTLGW